ncbi:hypothetical protein FOYG_02300 [Fusarium oxysporum NRRL 32931]|uniref:Hydrophobin n=1 Tax=Fusarium oxysporum NRRL 32931 TaxID=660029 RepID=W9IY80_FUSOX|nr:hypothetical protein FOYG_02300 [Fusarium oxysporum NRRL 32931]KAH7187134.1 hypothetical protein DER44DRAFT_834151 [Fusarium oxysporum]
MNIFTILAATAVAVSADKCSDMSKPTLVCCGTLSKFGVCVPVLNIGSCENEGQLACYPQSAKKNICLVVQNCGPVVDL